jgi:hypothetical protein
LTNSLVAGSGATAYAVHQFSFITSKYASFMHQIQSFNDIAWSQGRLIGSGANNPLLSPDDKTILEDILSDLSAVNSYQKEIEAKMFEYISQLFKLGTKQLPRSIEILALDENSESEESSAVSYGFLLEP